jgi:hypothetical protein
MLNKLLGVFLLILSVFFLGCSTHSVLPPKKYNNNVQKEVLQYIIKVKKDYYKISTLEVPKNAKVFVMNIFPDEEKRAKAMFNYAIEYMKTHGLLYQDKDKGRYKYVPHPKLEITKDGEEAYLYLDSLKGKMDKYDAFSAVIDFNKKYFPGFNLLKPEALMFVYTKMKITNPFLDDEYYKECRIYGDLIKALKENGDIIVNDPKEADYILVYQNLACNKYYIGHQPKSILRLVENPKKVKTAYNRNTQVFHQTGSFGANDVFAGYGYSTIISSQFGTYFKPTFAATTLAFALLSNSIHYEGVSYEALLIDVKHKRYANYVKTCKIGRETIYGNSLDSCAKTVAEKIFKYE